jgi:hypothetical protein
MYRSTIKYDWNHVRLLKKTPEQPLVPKYPVKLRLKKNARTTTSLTYSPYQNILSNCVCQNVRATLASMAFSSLVASCHVIRNRNTVEET